MIQLTRHDTRTARLCKGIVGAESGHDATGQSTHPAPEGPREVLPMPRRLTPRGTWMPRELPADTDDALC
ncbi:MAG: hypothetical protein GC151_18360 [Betaproteobacteria bacterium]|nr:hypothetical protein [Betaproteobacteria bacterium]